MGVLSVSDNDEKRCQEIKLDGDQCTREAEPGKEYCWQHAPDENVGGSPGKYEKEWKDKLDVVKHLLMAGLNNTEVAEKMDISKRTFNRWQNRHEEFRQAVEEGQRYKVKALEDTAYKRAQGFKYTEEQLTNSGEVVEVEKQALPHVGQIKFLLKQWAPEKYKDKKHIDADVDFNPIDAIIQADEEMTEDGS